jgi:thiol:disulfide interchange protein DsbD
MKKTFLLSLLSMVLGLTTAFAQIQDPVQFKTELKTISETEAQIVFTGVIDAGWHVYSTGLPEGGPISATFNTDKMEGVELDGKLMPEGKEIEAFDKVFEMKLRYFEGKATFVQKLKITAANYFIEGYLEYGSCNDENCLPPTEVSFSFSGKGAAGAPAAAPAEAKKEEKPTESVSSERILKSASMEIREDLSKPPSAPEAPTRIENPPKVIASPCFVTRTPVSPMANRVSHFTCWLPA